MGDSINIKDYIQSIENRVQSLVENDNIEETKIKQWKKRYGKNNAENE